MTINTVYSKHAGKITMFNSVNFFFQLVPVIFQKSNAYLQCVHNNCARFEECQANGEREVIAVYNSKHAGKMTKFNYM
jgi:hypothetical protein